MAGMSKGSKSEDLRYLHESNSDEEKNTNNVEDKSKRIAVETSRTGISEEDLDSLFKDVFGNINKSMESLVAEDASSKKQAGPSVKGRTGSTTSQAHGKSEDAFGSEEILPCTSCEFPDPLELEKVMCWGMCRKRRRLKDLCEFWLVSVPGDIHGKEKLNDRLQRNGLAICYTYHIPEFKIGTLNILVSLTEQLTTLNSYVKDVTVKLCAYIKQEMNSTGNAPEEYILVNCASPPKYLTRFVWNKSKFPPWHQIPLIVDKIVGHIEKIDNIYKQKHDVLEGMSTSLKKYDRRETDSLKYRYLGDIVKKEHFVQNSRFLITLLVVVPKPKINQWLKTYEHFTDMVVPNSSTKITEDDEYALFTVTLCKKDIDNFKLKARQNNFIVRDFTFSEDEQNAENLYYEKLTVINRRQRAAFLKWTTVNFGECFEAWVHVMALRVFVESVLRYGLPVNFESMLLLPLKSKTKLKNLLKKLFSNVDVKFDREQFSAIPGALTNYDVEDYYPYVHFTINMKFIC